MNIFPTVTKLYKLRKEWKRQNTLDSRLLTLSINPISKKMKSYTVITVRFIGQALHCAKFLLSVWSKEHHRAGYCYHVWPQQKCRLRCPGSALTCANRNKYTFKPLFFLPLNCEGQEGKSKDFSVGPSILLLLGILANLSGCVCVSACAFIAPQLEGEKLGKRTGPQWIWW